MEDPAKRRERLLSLRSEASHAGAGPAPPQAGELPDPLFSFPAETAAERGRFDFYTNPSAAFVGNNKRKNEGFVPGSDSASFARNVGPRNYMNPRESHTQQFQPPFNPQWRSPVQFQPPLPGHRPPPGAPGPWTTPPSNPNPNFRGGFTNPNYTYPPRGGFSNPNPNYTHPSRGGFSNPNPNYSQPSRGGFSNPNPSYMHPSRGGFSNPNPNFIRGCRPGTSPNPNPNFYSGSRGRGGGRGLGFNNRFGNPNLYIKSMVEDPWIELEPIVGKLVESFNESVRKNDSRKFDQGENTNTNSNKSSISSNNEKKLSLAEYLDLSFNQAIDET